ncbi:exonuclease [Pseudomonas phage VSW-3]|uniref:Exonuclease n=1 Tax=Pseudomonas phage VSW-3 TaxID=1852562 RepID=A0A173GCZ0_9CAUD|nr:exonuclease [Pseudomonas phage VSW-3]ANH51083.1 hypothetical protein VSW3_7 [Pseudomonas phage VSW-3]
MDLASAIAAAADDAVPLVFKAPTIVPGRWLLVDGDYLVYYCSGNNETPIGDARTRLMQKLDDMRIAAGAEKVVLHLTATGSHKGWRYVAATVKPYQENRSKSQRPKNWEQLRDFVESYQGLAFKPKIWGTREADDGICYHKEVLPYGSAVVAMKDKDSQMFDDCIHLDWETYEITEVPKGTFEIENSLGRLFGSKWFWLQLLMGDGADNIPGLPQILSHTGKLVQCGEARAKTALCMSVDDDDALDRVCKHYARYYSTEWADRLVEQMILLWMRKDKEATLLDFMRMVPETSVYHQPIIDAAVRKRQVIQEIIDATPD